MGPEWSSEHHALLYDGRIEAIFLSNEEAARAAQCLNILMYFKNPSLFTLLDLQELYRLKKKAKGEG